MGHQRISVCTNGNTNSDGHADFYTNANSHGDADANSDGNADNYPISNPSSDIHPNPNADGNAHNYSFSHGYPDALSSNGSELRRRENSIRADHLATRRIHYGGNHEGAAGA